MDKAEALSLACLNARPQEIEFEDCQFCSGRKANVGWCDTVGQWTVLDYCGRLAESSGD